MAPRTKSRRAGSRRDALADVDVRGGNPAAAAGAGFLHDVVNNLGLGKEIKFESSQPSASRRCYSSASRVSSDTIVNLTVTIA